MKPHTIFYCLLFFSALLSCCRNDCETNLLAPLDAIPETKYFGSDPFSDKHSDIYGAWKVVGTAGGIHGGGYAPDFDLLLVKPNAIFGIVRNDSLLTTGKIAVQNDPDFDLLVYFLSEDSNSTNIQLLWDYEKYIEFKSDTLFLRSPCCDRFDTILKRMQ